jgi:hypothetical protein
MSSTITVDLPDEVRSALDAATEAEGVAPDDIIARALKHYLFVTELRRLRAESQEHLRREGFG